MHRSKVRKTVAEYERFKVAFDRWLAAGQEIKAAKTPENNRKFEAAREALFQARSALS